MEAGTEAGGAGAAAGPGEKRGRAGEARGAAVAAGAACPWLGTVRRGRLDFDFEKCCSVSLSPDHVYACLVCGRYFQGRGRGTAAHTHSLEAGHHLFMALEGGRVFCLPNGYEVRGEPALEDVQYNLDPTYSAEAVAALGPVGSAAAGTSEALDGQVFRPGTVGLNNLKASDYANVVFQSLNRVRPLRDFFLDKARSSGCSSKVVRRFGEVVRKMWNPRAFKGQVSPHELMLAIAAESGGRFAAGAQADPTEFLAWLLHTLHRGLAARPGAKPRKRTVVTECFQGELEVETVRTGGIARHKFFMLALDLPPSPVFPDDGEKNILPQVPFLELLLKYDGERAAESIKHGPRRFRLTRLPPFLIFHYQRFVRNNFFLEKNPTIVTFPVKNLELRGHVPVPEGAESKYDLAASVVHDGEAGGGQYKVQVRGAEPGVWWEIQDLVVSETLPQMVTLAEAYLQIFERQ